MLFKWFTVGGFPLLPAVGAFPDDEVGRGAWCGEELVFLQDAVFDGCGGAFLGDVLGYGVVGVACDGASLFDDDAFWCLYCLGGDGAFAVDAALQVQSQVVVLRLGFGLLWCVVEWFEDGVAEDSHDECGVVDELFEFALFFFGGVAGVGVVGVHDLVSSGVEGEVVEPVFEVANFGGGPGSRWLR